jgi:thiol-disulfide isomerase/thioredoxin
MSVLQQATPATAQTQESGEFLVVCLCAEWCGTCREYQTGFDELATQFPNSRFRWFDIEDHADDLGDLDIENFPTLLIQRQEQILFFGTMLPHLSHLRRLIETFHEQTLEQSRDYVLSNPERCLWQDDQDLRHIGQVMRRD